MIFDEIRSLLINKDGSLTMLGKFAVGATLTWSGLLAFKSGTLFLSGNLAGGFYLAVPAVGCLIMWLCLADKRPGLAVVAFLIAGSITASMPMPP